MAYNEEIKVRLGAHSAHFYAFRRNKEELQSAISLLTPEKFEKDGSADLHDEIARLLHNWLASSASLVEAYRTFFSDVEVPQAIVEAYHIRVKEEFSRDIHLFVKGLRNYTLHKKLPPLVGCHHRTTHGEVVVENRCNFGIQKGALLKWDGWSRSAKDFMAVADPFLDLSPIIDEHSEKVADLFGWFKSQIEATSHCAT